MNEITTETVTSMVAATPPKSLLERAVDNNASVETLEKLMGLEERWQAGRAKSAFIASMAIARAKFGPVLKKNDGYANRYKYETIADIMDAVDVPLSENGLFYSWSTEDLPDGFIRVTCEISHEMGHVKCNSLMGHPDDTADEKANMNGLQRKLGAITYLQRGTLKAALGLASGKDMDGRASDRDLSLSITADQFSELTGLLAQSGSREADLLVFVGAVDLHDLTLHQYAKGKAAMLSKISNAKKESKS